MKYLIWPLLILLIIARYFNTRPVFRTGDRVKITTTVYTDPVIYGNSQYLRISGLKVYLPLTPEITYGDKIILEGVIEGDKLKNPKIVDVGEGRFLLTNFRNKVIAFYQNNLPQPEGGLLAGIVLGAKGVVSRDFYDRTKLTGVAHIVVASGTNVTFVAAFLMSLATLIFSRRGAIVFVILGITSYLFISGFDAPLVRAAIMATVAFLAQETGRVVAAWRIFFLTVGAMLVVNPDWLTDTGFFLSFASTAALLLFEKRIREKLNFIPKIIKEDLSTSLAAQIGVAPILFVTFRQFNIWSPLINTLVLWTVAPLMIIGVVGGIAGVIFGSAGRLILYLGYPMLWWFVKVVGAFS